MADVKITGLHKHFGGVHAVRGVDLDIPDGEFTVLVGPSGCGKSTLLRAIAGLEEVDSGTIEIDGEIVNDMPPRGRDVAMVFQDYALYPHMTAFANISLSLRARGMAKPEIELRVKRVAEMLGIIGLLDRYPRQLSGGQRQRVAIGRAIVREPRIFLFDEPLSNLDAELRVQMRVEIAKLHEDVGATMIYVTHDQVEAMTMADKIVVLRAGRIEQVGAPLDLYNRPANRFVAGFIGSPKMNFLAASAQRPGGAGTAVSLAGCGLTLPLEPARGALGDGTVFGVRPEHIAIGGDSGTPFAAARILHIEHLGGATLIYATLSDGQKLTIALEGQCRLAPGTLIETRIDPTLCHLFAADDTAFAPIG